MTEKSIIRAHQEVIWHLTCGYCHYYWTYPTMNISEDITKREFHCPLCGTKSDVKIDDSMSGV